MDIGAYFFAYGSSIGAYGFLLAITSVSSDDTVSPAENPWNITGTGFGAD